GRAACRARPHDDAQSWLKSRTVLPLAATVDTASAKETQTFAEKVEELLEETDYVLADSGYDSNELGERIEYDEQDQRTSRRFLCPENRRSSKQPATDQRPRDEPLRRRLSVAATFELR